jgi:hypothetical protein
MVGEIPEGFQIDHVAALGCAHKHCVNPAHLEAVTAGVNTRRYHDSLSFCRNGHPREDLYVDPSGRKRCRGCRRAAHRRWLARNAAYA